jgi:hypothetical protein
MAAVPGVGPNKLAKYGSAFLAVLSSGGTGVEADDASV